MGKVYERSCVDHSHVVFCKCEQIQNQTEGPGGTLSLSIGKVFVQLKFHEPPQLTFLALLNSFSYVVATFSCDIFMGNL